jgi:hypothetical protein
MKYSIFQRRGLIIVFFILLNTGLLHRVSGQQAAKTVSFDFSQKRGRIKALNGINIGTVKKMAAWTDYMTRTYAELKIPLTRLHDCQFSNPGVVDIPAIFPLFHLDPDDPGNYNFKKTDDYLLELLKSGTKISYRLGVDIEHGKVKYYIFPPEDFDKWAKICVNIIRHYNDGWANGYHLNIRYWEIWNEPGGRDEMWMADIEQYYKLYETTVKAIKKYNPELMVGTAGIGPYRTGSGLIQYCKDHNLPIDFFPWHIYTWNLNFVDSTAFYVRKMLDDNGYKNTEIHLNEWNYFPKGGSWKRLFHDRSYWKKLALEEIGGMNGAAFTANMLINLQDLPVDQACYYSGTWEIFGLFDEYGIPKKPFYVYRAFAMLLNTPGRVSCEKASLPEGMSVIGGLNKLNDVATIMISNYNAPVDTLHVRISGLPWKGGIRAEVFTLDNENDLTPAPDYKIRFDNAFTLKECSTAPVMKIIRLYPVKP